MTNTEILMCIEDNNNMFWELSKNVSNLTHRTYSEIFEDAFVLCKKNKYLAANLHLIYLTNYLFYIPTTVFIQDTKKLFISNISEDPEEDYFLQYKKIAANMSHVSEFEIMKIFALKHWTILREIVTNFHQDKKEIWLKSSQATYNYNILLYLYFNQDQLC